MRHPLDPDPVPSTKAAAVLALGIMAIVTGPFVGGVVPGALALVLAREAGDDITAAGGFLTGLRRVQWGVRLAQLGMLAALVSIVIATTIGIFTLAP